MDEDAALNGALARVAPEARVRRYYAPVARFCVDRLRASAKRPLVFGVSGPQGAGKSTLADALVVGLGALGYRGVAISIDDFYLTHDEQLRLSEAHPDNPYLAYRGYPGTHDVALGDATLASLAQGRPTVLPAYDKSAFAGRGDRAPEATFRRVEERLHFVVLEGWMLAFSPLDASALEDAALEAPNEMLAPYRAWTDRIDAMIVLVASRPEDIVTWRVDAERQRREAGASALTDDQARDYIERFLPAYRAWVPGLLASSDARPTMTLRLGRDREPVADPAE